MSVSIIIFLDPSPQKCERHNEKRVGGTNRLSDLFCEIQDFVVDVMLLPIITMIHFLLFNPGEERHDDGGIVESANTAVAGNCVRTE